MSARTIRRTFASSFVVTLATVPAACVVQSAPPPRSGPPMTQPGPQTSEPAQPTPADPGPTTPQVISNPPPPGAEQATPPKPEAPAKTERHWTVMKIGGKCRAYVQVACPAGAICNPPPPTDYACTPEITDAAPMKIVQWANTTGCHVETPAPPCPPQTMCNPPRPRAVTCPQ